jgi:hypothetical protein
MSEWISVKDKLPKLDADNCCLDEEDYGRYSDPVLVFDEMCGRALVAGFDGREKKWIGDDGDILYDVTHWMPLPEPPEVLCDTLDSL